MTTSYTLKNGTELQVRDITVDDAAAMLEYLKVVGGETDFLTFGAEGVGYTLEEEQAFIRSKAEDERTLFAIGTVDDQIIAGIGVMVGNRERVCHCGEIGMSVRKDFWNLGAGGCLMDYIIEWARDQESLKKLNLSVRTDNRRAINLYLKKGFVVEGCNRGAIKMGDTLYDVYIMGSFL